MHNLGIRVLLQPTNLVPVKYKVHMPQSALGSFANGVTRFPSVDDLCVFDESLPADLD